MRTREFRFGVTTVQQLEETWNAFTALTIGPEISHPITVNVLKFSNQIVEGNT